MIFYYYFHFFFIITTLYFIIKKGVCNCKRHTLVHVDSIYKSLSRKLTKNVQLSHLPDLITFQLV
jgi:hypothetical protein